MNVPKHIYTGDSIPDHHGEDRCSQCQMPKGHANHTLPPAGPEQAEHRQRIGEKD